MDLTTGLLACAIWDTVVTRILRGTMPAKVPREEILSKLGEFNELKGSCRFDVKELSEHIDVFKKKVPKKSQSTHTKSADPAELRCILRSKLP